MNKQKSKLFLICAGILNGLFGAGGGMIIVPILRKNGFDENKSHALCVTIILPLCILSAAVYLLTGKVTLSDTLVYLPWTVIGSIIGSILLPKCKAGFIRILFGALIIFAAGRMIFS